jgi:hypothetical protein
MISVLIPTRKRPEQLRRVVESLKATVHGYSPQIVAYVDNDDSSYDAFKGYGRDVLFIQGPRIVLSNMWNKCAEAACGDILMQGNDDIIFRTTGWDRIIEEEFAKFSDRIVMVHGSDGSNHDSGSGHFGPHPFISRQWMEALGYFTAPYFSSDYGDTWLNDLANAIGRRRYVPLVVEHMHYIFGKAETDQTTSERLERHSQDNVAQLYSDLAALREIDIEKLKAAMR